jgi:hypothetical protein
MCTGCQQARALCVGQSSRLYRLETPALLNDVDIAGFVWFTTIYMDGIWMEHKSDDDNWR